VDYTLNQQALQSTIKSGGDHVSTGGRQIFMSGSSTYTVGMASGSAVSDTLVDNEWHVHTLVFDGTQTGNSNRLKYRIDGYQRNLTFTNDVSSSTSPLGNSMLFGINADDTDYFKGYMGEVLLYTKALSTTEITNTENYLFTKWGMSAIPPSPTPSITVSATPSITPSSNPSLYAFTSQTFTSAGVSGSTGPTYAQMLAAYTGSATWAATSSYFTSSQQGYQVWTVPQSGYYDIEAAGSRSSQSTYPTSSFARGAVVKGAVYLNQGQKLTMVVGQFSAPPTSAASYNGLGGGGGTFVVTGSLPIFVAGGAGGIGAYSGDPTPAYKSGSNGTTTTSGSNSFRNAGGGSGSFGGYSHLSTGSVVSINGYDGGGGGGFRGNGYQGVNGAIAINANAGAQAGGAGLSFLSGSTGGGASTSYALTQATPGGFGGGGGGTPIAGGGGGGYSGGAGSYGASNTLSDGGGGGGSFITGSALFVSSSNGQYERSSAFNGYSINNLGYFNTGSGYVRITLLNNVILPSPSVTPSLSITPSVTPTTTPSTSTTPSVSITPSITRTVSVTPTVTPTISITPTTTPSSGSSPTIVTSGLVFNLATAPSSGTTWTDTTGNGYNATLQGASAYTSSFGGGVRLENTTFAGTGYISVPYNFTSSITTVEVVASFNPTSNWATIWGNENYNAGSGYFAYMPNATSIVYGKSTAPSTESITASNNVRHWVFVIDGTNHSLYLNGTQVGTTDSVAIQTLFTTNNFYFGSRHTNDGTGATDKLNNTTAAFYPAFYQMRLYGRALSLAEITQNFNAIKSTYGL
jgi:hypothetical protein